MNRLLVFQGALYTIIAALTPAATMLASDAQMTMRAIICLALSCIIAGATALKAFLSTTFSESAASQPDIPAPVGTVPPPLRTA